MSVAIANPLKRARTFDDVLEPRRPYKASRISLDDVASRPSSARRRPQSIGLLDYVASRLSQHKPGTSPVNRTTSAPGELGGSEPIRTPIVNVTNPLLSKTINPLPSGVRRRKMRPKPLILGATAHIVRQISPLVPSADGDAHSASTHRFLEVREPTPAASMRLKRERSDRVLRNALLRAFGQEKKKEVSKRLARRAQ